LVTVEGGRGKWGEFLLKHFSRKRDKDHFIHKWENSREEGFCISRKL